jgi:hypothetical protein
LTFGKFERKISEKGVLAKRLRQPFDLDHREFALPLLIMTFC